MKNKKILSISNRDIIILGFAIGLFNNYFITGGAGISFVLSLIASTLVILGIIKFIIAKLRGRKNKKDNKTI